MTQALQSQNVVKSLLQAWNAVHESKINITMSTDHSGCQLSAMASGSDSFPVMRLAKSSSVSASNMNLSNRLGIVDNSSSPCNLMFQNSVTAGVLDSTVKQWVHVVCGLWTPGAHCRNDATLNAFDVSDALSSKDNAVRTKQTNWRGFNMIYLVILFILAGNLEKAIFFVVSEFLWPQKL